MVGVGADLCHSGPEAPTTKDTFKASLSDLESKGDHLNQAPNPQVLTKSLGVQSQVVPVNVHPALMAMGMDTTILSRPLQLAGRLQHFLSNWQLLTRDQFILEMVVGIQIPFTIFPHQSRVPPPTFHNQSEKVAIDQEISEMLQKGAIQVVSPMNGEFLSSVFLVKKKDGGNRPVINLKELNSYVTYQHFKMEGLYLLKHLIQTGDWMIKIDLKDAYFTVPVSKPHQPLLRFMHRGLRYQFSCLPFGLGPAPRLFTKLLKPVVALLRRLGLRLVIYLDDIIVFSQTQEGILRDRDSTLWLLQHLGFVINWKKSVLHPAQCMEYLGFVINSIEMKLFLPSGKMSHLVQECKDLILEKSASVRTLSHIIGKLTSTMQAVLPAPLHYRHLQMLQVKGLLEGKGYNSVVPLNKECQNDLQWWINQLSTWNGRSLISPAPDLTITTDASLKGWGAVCQGVHTRGLWTPEESLLHINALELKAALFALRAFSNDRRKIHVHLRMDNRTAVAYLLKMGGDTVSGSSRDSPGTMGIRPEEGNFPDSRILARGFESRSRLAVKTFQGCEQLETESQSFSYIRPVMGPPHNRSLCGSHEHTTSELYELVPRPLCSGNRCLSDSLVEREGLLLSPIFTDLPLSGKDKEGPGNNGSDSANLASHSTPPTEGSFTLSQPTATPSDSAGPPAISGLDGYRQNLLTGGVSEDTANLLRSHSWRKGTAGAYNSAWKQWSSWCGQRKVDPFCSTVASIADYLTELFKKGRSYHTVNIHRSAISAFHRPIDGVQVGQHDLVCRVLNACFNAKPPQPRYVVTWDVDKVLSYIHSLGENSSLSNKCLTLKLSMLLALASAGRSSDLRALDIRYMTRNDNSINFELGVLTKSRRKGQPPIKLTFDRFDSDPLVCVVSTISCYLDRSKAWRAGADKTQLLLSYIRPHTEVVPCTIAGWLVELMKQSGIDTSEFRAHSTRGASTSKAKAKGLSCQEILAMANWKKESTFRRHYLREIASESAGSFQAVVLQEG